MNSTIIRVSYNCKKCDFISSNKSDYNRHILSTKHRKTRENDRVSDNTIPPQNINFNCERCDFMSNNKTDYNRHLISKKHCNNEANETKIVDKFVCLCGNTYKYQPGLSKHRKTCTFIKTSANDPNISTYLVECTQEKSVDISNQLVGTNQFSNELLYNLLKEITISNAKNDELQKQNMEIKNMFIEQSVQLNQQNAQLIELVNKPSTINNNTTMNKPKFNLNLFLNEECKNAMNWLEFAELVKSKICFADLEYMGKHGYVAGQSKIIKDNLQNIEVNKRPFHCTDIKRKTVHIKDQDEWKREEGHSTTLTKLVNKIEHTENVVLYDWIQTKPDCYKHNSPDNQTYMDIATAITKHAHGDNQDKALVEVLQNVMVERT